MFSKRQTPPPPVTHQGQVGPLPNMISFHVQRPQDPTKEEIEKLFSDLIKDLDYDPKKLKVMATWDPKEKYEFIKGQEEQEKRVPDPQWLVDTFAQADPSLLPRLFNTCFLNLRTARLSWVSSFCNAGGHIFLLRHLSSLTSFHNVFDDSFPRREEEVMELLNGLRSLVDCVRGSSHLLYFAPGVEILVNTLSRFNSERNKAVLLILMPFIFLDHGATLLIKAFKKLSRDFHSKSLFKIFAHQIEKDPHEEIFFTFLNGLYTAVTFNYPLRLYFDFDFKHSNLIEILKPQSSNPKVAAFIEAVTQDFQDLSEIFSGKPQLVRNTLDITKIMSQNSYFPAVLMNLYSLLCNQRENFDAVLIHLFHFTLALRYFLLKKDNLSNSSIDEEIVNAEDYAYHRNTPPDLLLSSSDTTSSLLYSNMFYQFLKETFNYVADQDLKDVGSLTSGNQNNNNQNQNDQNNDQNSDQNSNNNEADQETSKKVYTPFSPLEPRPSPLYEREIQELKDAKEKLEQANQKKDQEIAEMKAEIEKMKEQFEAALRAENEKLTLENNKLKEEINYYQNLNIDQLKTELNEVKETNTELETRFSKLTELINFIPKDVSKIVFSKVTVESIIPKETADIKGLLSALEQLKDTLPEKDQELFNQIRIASNALINDRETTTASARALIQTINSERQAVRSEFAQVTELQKRIINTVNGSNSSDNTDSNAENEEFLLESSLKDIDTSKIDLESKNNYIKCFAWHEIKNNDSSNVFKEEPLEFDENKLIEYFTIEKIEEGHVLSTINQVKYAKFIDKYNIQPKQFSRNILEEKFSIESNVLQDLLGLPISAAELKLGNEFTGDLESLPASEQLSIYLNKIPNWRSKAETMLEHRLFDKNITILLQNAKKIQECYTILKNSQKFKGLLATVLKAGNILNQGLQTGNATGFSISDLKSLRSVKSNEKRLSLIHWIVQECSKTQQEKLQILTELDKIQPGARLDLSQIIIQLRSALTTLASRPRDAFVVSSSARILGDLKKVEEIEQECNKISREFGARGDIFKPNDLLQTAIDFALDITKATKENKMKATVVATSQSIAKVASETKEALEQQRGLVNTMVSTLMAADAIKARKQASKFVLETNEDEPNDFMKAFAKVKKTVQ